MVGPETPRRHSERLVHEGRDWRAGIRPRVLIVDDDDALADSLRTALADEGYAVATARHGAAALELIATHEPAILIVDLRMPIMDGRSFIEQYRRVAKHPRPIVVLTGARDGREAADALGVDGFVAKPFELPELAATLRHCLNGGAPAQGS